MGALCSSLLLFQAKRKALRKSLVAAAAGEAILEAPDMEDSGPSEMQLEADRMQAEIDAGTLDLPDKIEKEKIRILAAGFPEWSKLDFKAFVAALERYGTDGVAKEAVVSEVCEETGKPVEEVRRYYSVFFKKNRSLADCARVMDRITKGQKKIERLHEIAGAVAMKLFRHYGKNYDTIARSSAASIANFYSADDDFLAPWSLSLGGGSTKGRYFTEEEDRYLVMLMHKHGYGCSAWEAMHADICKEPAFRFDWFFISRQPSDIQKRCEILLRAIEKENVEYPLIMPSLTNGQSTTAEHSSPLSLKLSLKNNTGVEGGDAETSAAPDNDGSAPLSSPSGIAKGSAKKGGGRSKKRGAGEEQGAMSSGRAPVTKKARRSVESEPIAST